MMKITLKILLAMLLALVNWVMGYFAIFPITGLGICSTNPTIFSFLFGSLLIVFLQIISGLILGGAWLIGCVSFSLPLATIAFNETVEDRRLACVGAIIACIAGGYLGARIRESWKSG